MAAVALLLMSSNCNTFGYSSNLSALNPFVILSLVSHLAWYTSCLLNCRQFCCSTSLQGLRLRIQPSESNATDKLCIFTAQCQIFQHIQVQRQGRLVSIYLAGQDRNFGSLLLTQSMHNGAAISTLLLIVTQFSNKASMAPLPCKSCGPKRFTIKSCSCVTRRHGTIFATRSLLTWVRATGCLIHRLSKWAE